MSPGVFVYQLFFLFAFISVKCRIGVERKKHHHVNRRSDLSAYRALFAFFFIVIIKLNVIDRYPAAIFSLFPASV